MPIWSPGRYIPTQKIPKCPPPGVIIQSQRTKVNLVPRSTFPPSQQFVTKKNIKKERFFYFKAKRRESSEMTEIPQNNVAFAWSKFSSLIQHSPAPNAELCGSKFYHHANQYGRIPVTISRVGFLWSNILERDILLIYRTCFVVNPGTGLTCFASSSLKERGMLQIHSAYFVSWWFNERDILTHPLYLTKISFVSLYTWRISVGRLTLRVSGDITFARLDRLLLTKLV